MTQLQRWDTAARTWLSSRCPSRYERIAFATVVAILAGYAAFSQFDSGRSHSDFGMVWYGARAMLHGANPYDLIGPGREFNYDWPLIYPATALVAAFPLTALSEQMATAAFVIAST